MACAGYLILNNANVVYAELADGELVCTPVASMVVESPASLPSPILDATHDPLLDSATLPLLDVHPLPRQSSTTHAPPSAPPPTSDCHRWKRYPDTTSNLHRRHFQLSGCLVEVKDKRTTTTLDQNFQIVTSKLTNVKPDGTCHSTSYVDSIVLTALDRSSKSKWMHHLRRWHRYAWREPEHVCASTKDAEALDRLLHPVVDAVKVDSLTAPTVPADKKVNLAMTMPALMTYGSNRTRRRVDCSRNRNRARYHLLEEPEDETRIQVVIQDKCHVRSKSKSKASRCKSVDEGHSSFSQKCSRSARIGSSTTRWTLDLERL